MDKRTHYYVSPKNGLTWIMAICLVCSVVARIVAVCVKGADGSAFVWGQVVLPTAATLLYILIALLMGKEQYYKTAIPVWLLCLYFGFAVQNYQFGRMVEGLFWVALLFLAVSYTAITSGSFPWIILLVPLFASPLCAVGYLHREELLAGDVLGALPDGLLCTGLLIGALAVRYYPAGQYHPTWGDRKDGRRIRTLPPMNMVSPYIMVARNESSNLYEDSIEITNIERYLRQKRAEGMTNFGFMHLLLAAYVRGVAKYPALNRFLAGQKIYSRGNDIQFCITIKKEMTVSSPDTVIKVHLSPYDTTADIYRKVSEAVEEVKNAPLDSDFDNTAHALTMLPGVLLKFAVWLLKLLDYFDLLPKFLLEVSPFHGSIFLTNLGSLGISPVYHHLYDFGNLPVFGAFGCKRKTVEVQEDGTVVPRKYVDIRFTLDERVVDGYYYAVFFKYVRRLLAHPEVLDQPPQSVASDID
ncbi:MAG: 2-oxo acid dehydrogenase subunit E2 [Faecousia sp.]